MAKNWFVDTSADREVVLKAAADLFFTKPDLGTRMKFWSKAAQLQSNIRWSEASVAGADLAASVVSGGLREVAGASKHGGGSMIGTTIGLRVEPAATSGSTVQFSLTSYNTFFGVNQQGDLVKSYAKQLAALLSAAGHSTSASRR